MQQQSKWLTTLIVAAVVSLVLGPVFVPREIARWYLAAAQNAYRIKNSVLAEHYLAQAVAWDEDIQKDGDYWIAQLPGEAQNADQLLDLLEKAVMSDSRWKPKAEEASQVLAEDHDYQRAIRALKISFLNQRPTQPSDLNQLAYLRSLAGLDLEEALKDIDEAISRATDGAKLEDVLRRETVASTGQLYGYLDTKAWILHGMGRHLEALGYMQKALEYIEKEFEFAGLVQPAALDAETLEKVNDYENVDAAISAAKVRLGAGFTLAVLRFHRLRILEALGRNAEAETDRQWLVDRGVPIADELF